MEKISFIIRNYNVVEYSKWAYESIRKNLDNDHEIVLVDDGSTDGTQDWIKEVASKDDNIKYYLGEENIGIAFIHNKGVELSSNEIICDVHSDMYITPKSTLIQIPI